MNTYISHIWKGVLVAMVVLMVLGSAAQAFWATAESQEVTLSATVRDPAGSTGTFDFTFELEEMPVVFAALPNYSTLPSEPSTVPDPSTLAPVGLGALGLVALRKRWDTRRSS